MIDRIMISLAVIGVSLVALGTGMIASDHFNRIGLAADASGHSLTKEQAGCPTSPQRTERNSQTLVVPGWKIAAQNVSTVVASQPW